MRYEREAVGTTTALVPWLTPGQTPGTGGNDAMVAQPGVSMFNILIQMFANGATGFNMFQTLGMYDGALWLSMRDAIAAVTPFEDLLCDGEPASPGALQLGGAHAVVSAMRDGAGTLLIASSTTPAGLATAWVVRSANASESWKLCDVLTLRAVAASSGGSASWSSAAENGTVLAFGPATPCHVA